MIRESTPLPERLGDDAFLLKIPEDMTEERATRALSENLNEQRDGGGFPELKMVGGVVAHIKVILGTPWAGEGPSRVIINAIEDVEKKCGYADSGLIMFQLFERREQLLQQQLSQVSSKGR